MQSHLQIGAIVSVVGLLCLFIFFPYLAPTAIIVVSMTAIGLYYFRSATSEKAFITKLFLGAIAVRLLFGLILHIYDLQDFLAPDATGYDKKGRIISEIWLGTRTVFGNEYDVTTNTSGAGWGMNYLVGSLYYIFGPNMLAAQSFCAMLGAATPPLTFLCSYRLYSNVRVAKISSLFIAFFPAFVIWSSQLLKDGIIVFLLVLTMTMVLELQQRFSYRAIIALGVSLFGVFSLRFYIIYMLAAAVAGSFIVGVSQTTASGARRVAALFLLGVGLTYFGVVEKAGAELEKYGSLERIELSRRDLASVGSGFGRELDVSSTEGAISTVPIGLAYLMLAPFPWDSGSWRQSFVLPENFLWWSLLPFMFYGLYYTLWNRLRSATPILIFSMMLTLAYSIFQGNIGTAYRQRTQIQVFLFIFIAVGIALILEKREDRKLIERQSRMRRPAGGAAVSHSITS